MFQCNECITEPEDDKVSGIGIKFKTKDDCYRFINLFGELRDRFKAQK